jgi:hypothetical protein
MQHTPPCLGSGQHDSVAESQQVSLQQADDAGQQNEPPLQQISASQHAAPFLQVMQLLDLMLSS